MALLTMAGIAHARSSGSRYTIASGDVSVAVFYGTWVSHIYDDDEVRLRPRHVVVVVVVVVVAVVVVVW